MFGDNSLMLSVSVIIPTYRDWERLSLCLAAIGRQNYPKELYEVIVVNNDPDDPCPYKTLPCDNLSLLTEEKGGSYAARNTAIRFSRGQILAFTDSDCVPEPDWLAIGVNSLLSNSSISRIGGKIELLFSGDRLSLAEMYEKAFGFRQELYVHQDGAAATANMFTYRTVIENVGMFDETRFSGEDTGWGRRAQEKGWNIIYEPRCVVKHPARKKLSEIVKKSRRFVGGRFCDLSGKDHHHKFWLLAGLVPPIFIIGDLIKISQLTLREKICAYFVYYFLKVYQRWYWLLLKWGFRMPERT